MKRLATLLFWLAMAAAARAQAPISADTPIATLAASVDQADAQMKAISANLRSNRITDAELNRRIDEIPGIQATLTGSEANLVRRLADIDARLSQLGPKPGPGQPPDAPETASERAHLTAMRQAVDTEMKQAKLLKVEVNQVGRALVQRLRENFRRRLWTRGTTALNPQLWRDFFAEAPKDARHVVETTAEERQAFSAAASRPGRPVLWILALVTAAVMVGPLRLWLNRWGYRRAERGLPPDAAEADEAVTRFRQTCLALWLVFVAGATPAAAGYFLRAVLAADGALTGAFDEIALLAIRAVIVGGILEGLGRALLSPSRPRWRLAPLPEPIARRLAPFPGLIGITGPLATFLAQVNTVLGLGAATVMLSDRVFTFAELAAVGGALVTMARARRALLASEGHRPAAAGGRARLVWVLVAIAAWLAFAVSLVGVLTGYIALAEFVMREAIWIGVVLASLFLLMRFVDDLFPTMLSREARLGELFHLGVGLSPALLAQIAVLLSGMFRVFLLVLAFAAILAPFGASASQILASITSPDVMFHIGEVPISPGAIFGSIGLFLVGLMATRGVRGWLEVQYLPTTDLDVGVRTSLAAAITYAGGAIALLLALASLGVSFSQIALFASALSVGIGFGLQPVIGNFVSGLVLLAERPIRVGDWVAIGDLQGDVRKISIRATEIQMFDKSNIIVPNTELITKTVRNLTHSTAIGRVSIVLKIADDADPELVREILLNRAIAHPKVLDEPSPGVFLTDVKDGALEFTTFAYVATPRASFGVKSELLFQIIPDFKARGVSLYSNATVITMEPPAAASPILVPPHTPASRDPASDPEEERG